MTTGPSTITHDARCTPEAVWDVLADGWFFATWVVGASRIREVDDAWPEPGSRIHHSVGAWPALLDDSTSVLEAEPPRRLLLQARAWPAGEATVLLTLEKLADDGCRITIREDTTSGPARHIPQALLQPLMDVRNREALRRLALIAEGRSGAAGRSGPHP